MGNEIGKETVEDSKDPEEVAEFLDDNPRFLVDYIDRNPHLLDNYVYEKVDEATVKHWLSKVKAPSPSDVLQVLKLDYMKAKNTIAHRTDRYIHNSLVIRRAERFSLDILFKNRPYLPAKDQIVLEFSIGEKPKYAAGTLIKVPVKDSLQGSKWTCMLMDQDAANKKVSVDVNVPAEALIGRYKLSVRVTSELEDGKKTETTSRPDVIVIFNPFSPADDCYMENPEHRNEYVLNDRGCIFVGSYYRISRKDWIFGQFEEGILDIALKMLRKDGRAQKNPEKSLKKRLSPSYCSRVLSAMVNVNDDDGVLWGNWSGKYEEEGGKKPTFWNGSVKILKQWNSTEKPVKFGQCWVFSGLLTTVLRAIGIAARPITNFRSAHDTEFNMTIDRFIGEDGEESDLIDGYDSIWNFHVWNEGYFKRPDLPKGYDGWQAVDSTPQEVSSGLMQCGPAPVKAVKNGEIYVGYDTNFLFSEVNADVLTWSVDNEGEVTGLLKRALRDVGRNISTKAVGSDERHDVTDEYKYKEGTPQEREAFERAYAHGRKADWHDKFVIEEEGAITIDIKTEGENMNGEPVTAMIRVKNTTKESKDLHVTTVLQTMLNNDERKALVKRVKKDVTLAGESANDQAIVLQFSDYGSQLADENVIRVVTTVRVKETNKLYVDNYDIQLDNPKCLTIECDDTLTRNEYNLVSFTITNVFPVALTAGVFSVEGLGVSNGVSVKAGPIAVGETYKSKPVEVQPNRSGRTYLSADFDCKEILNIKAYKSVNVQ